MNIQCGEICRYSFGKISVIIPSYNRASIISSALDSVFNQTYKNFEIIVVDDGSVDNLREVVAKYGDKIIYLYQENKGPAAARNNGIRRANGEFVAFLDSDDTWSSLKLEKQIKCFEDNPCLGLVGTRYFNCDEKLRFPKQCQEIKMARSEFEEVLIRNIWPPSTIIVKRSCLDTVGMFKEDMRFAEDWDLWIRIARFFTVATVEEPLVYMRKHTNSLAGSAENNDYNFGQWKKLILSNFKSPTWNNVIIYLKSTSFYFLNLSYVLREQGDGRAANWYLFRSFMCWPFLVFKLLSTL